MSSYPVRLLNEIQTPFQERLTPILDGVAPLVAFNDPCVLQFWQFHVMKCANNAVLVGTVTPLRSNVLDEVRDSCYVPVGSAKVTHYKAAPLTREYGEQFVDRWFHCLSVRSRGIVWHHAQ